LASDKRMVFRIEIERIDELGEAGTAA
jgi:hypothetical protein